MIVDQIITRSKIKLSGTSVNFLKIGSILFLVLFAQLDEEQLVIRIIGILAT